jgi:glutaredoxin 3
METIRMYTTRWCGFCAAAKRLLQARGVPFEEIDIGDAPAFRSRLYELTGAWTVPQVMLGDRRIGGYSELRELDVDGRLDELRAA